MLPKVSVIVAVYNPGKNIDHLVSSLATQTLPADEFEVLFVDDGSTDGTGERLAEVVSGHPTWSVTTIANSGWPGRPRNVGTDMATGEYVFFADHDDEFPPEALERMYALAAENGSDIVYPKLVRSGRSTPYWSLARCTLPVADPLGEAMTSRTVHKLYRRQFLIDCGARFPEGRVRLEDHNFSSQVLPHAAVISVLADYPAYRWIHRTDGSNNSEAAADADLYWGYYTEVVQVMEREAGPGPLLDRGRVVAMSQAFSRLSPAGYLKRPEHGRRELFDAVRGFVTEQFPEQLDTQLPALKRLRVKALRAGSLEQFELLQQQRTEFTFRVGLTEARWSAGHLHLALEVSLANRSGGLYRLERSGDDLLLPDVRGTTGAPGDRVLLPPERGTLEVTLRHQGTGLEWPVAGSHEVEQVPVGTGVGLQMRGEADIDPAHGFFGDPLDDGTWVILARVQFLGESLASAVPATDAVGLPSALERVGDRDAAVLRTSQGKLVLRVPAEEADLAPTAGPPTVRSARWHDGDLQLDLDVHDGEEARWLGVRTRGHEDGHSVPVERGSAHVGIGGTRPGDIVDFRLHDGTPEQPTHERRLMFGDADVRQERPYRVYRTQYGSFSVKHERPPADQAAGRGLATVVSSALKKFSGKGRDRTGGR